MTPHHSVSGYNCFYTSFIPSFGDLGMIMVLLLLPLFCLGILLSISMEETVDENTEALYGFLVCKICSYGF